MSIYGGFALREQESKYNITVFDLILTLGARVTGTLKNSKQFAIYLTFSFSRNTWKYNDE